MDCYNIFIQYMKRMTSLILPIFFNIPWLAPGRSYGALVISSLKFEPWNTLSFLVNFHHGFSLFTCKFSFLVASTFMAHQLNDMNNVIHIYVIDYIKPNCIRLCMRYYNLLFICVFVEFSPLERVLLIRIFQQLTGPNMSEEFSLMNLEALFWYKHCGY